MVLHSQFSFICLGLAKSAVEIYRQMYGQLKTGLFNLIFSPATAFNFCREKKQPCTLSSIISRLSRRSPKTEPMQGTHEGGGGGGS